METIIIIIFVVIFYFCKRYKNKYKKINFDKISGVEFENFCVSLLRDNGFYNVSKTKASGDHGIDILATKNGLRYAIQCKRYSKNVGNKAVQEVYSGKAIYGADVAVVITNQFYTKQAVNDAEKLNVQLWDRNKLNSLINSSKKKNIFSYFKNSYRICEKPKQENKNKYSESFIEMYAKECCALLEHEDEMQDYMKHFNMKDESIDK